MRFIDRIVSQEGVNFFLTNCLPRRLTTRFIGWFSKIENPVVSGASIAVWKMFTDLDLSDAQTTRFGSLHACFTRALKPGARPPDPNPDVLASPCDAIVGACGRVEGEQLHQIKGSPYTLDDLLRDAAAVETFRNGRFVTLRLTSAMYHRFHAPHNLSVERVRHFPGDVWNVNPPALKRVKKLFCKNERAVIYCRLDPSGLPTLLVPVAAILVASIRLNFCDTHVRDAQGREIRCSAKLAKGQEMGWFEHGSTIVVFVPDGFELAEGIYQGTHVRAGQALIRMPAQGANSDPSQEN